LKKKKKKKKKTPQNPTFAGIGVSYIRDLFYSPFFIL